MMRIHNQSPRFGAVFLHREEMETYGIDPEQAKPFNLDELELHDKRTYYATGVDAAALNLAETQALPTSEEDMIGLKVYFLKLSQIGSQLNGKIDAALRGQRRPTMPEPLKKYYQPGVNTGLETLNEAKLSVLYPNETARRLHQYENIRVTLTDLFPPLPDEPIQKEPNKGWNW